MKSTGTGNSADVEVPTNDIRFQIELEFIQCLANPQYINCKQLLLAYDHIC
jgi:hypothetical protein